ncbi:TetR/AcrR family transcriptional regulator [Shewanella eurypsychrophilus]|uniref:TetR/AcrR family transcriptional regulator n=1 Tax=Shewanella eurypsychrophilus TaxID=2593656 RepID=A0ABX6VA71_9GAMM|nr:MULTISPECIES: TetR/AcrR family transcriptional regulator [Shewanella]QFU23540.1 TetR family transcriptional regulator [Shewanella sp. YLB-09]QPG58766.1 TetR/AcrR family transcriptional regulator [Shewanella eurypsychrophilus]
MNLVTPSANLSRSEQKRLQILEAAIELFCGQGFPNTSMDEVAKRACVSKQTVYSHFGSKDELFVASIESKCVVNRLTDDVFSDPSEPEAALHCFAEYFGELIVSPEAITVFTTCVAQAETHPEISKMFFNAGPQHLLELLSDYLERVEKLGIYRFDSGRNSAVRLCLMMFGEMRLKLELGLGVEDLVAGRPSYLKETITMFLKAYRVANQ